MKRINIRVAAILFVLAITVSAVSAQIPPSGNPGGSPQNLPLDGGAFALLAASGMYGYKKLKAKKTEE